LDLAKVSLYYLELEVELLLSSKEVVLLETPFLTAPNLYRLSEIPTIDDTDELYL